MIFMRMTALAIAATCLAAGTVSAGPLNPSGARMAAPAPQMQEVQYRGGYYRGGDDDAAGPAAIIGGIVGGALSNPCYFNDCGYGYGDGDGDGGRWGGRGWGGDRGGWGGRGGGYGGYRR